MKKQILLIAIFCAIGLQPLFAQQKPKDAQMEKRIEKLIKKMTLQEKTSLLHGNSKFYVSEIKRLGIPEWAFSDGPHGVRAEIQRHNWNYMGWTNDSSTYLPSGTAFAATWNTELAKSRGETLGEEAHARKKDVLLGPGVNIIRSPLGGRTFEYLSEDPYLCGVMAAEYIKGLQSRGVAASVKHFAVNNQETERNSINVEVSERALREIYLPAFKAAVIDGGALTVMTAYNKFRGDFCADNEYLLRKILKNEWHFDGVAVTDWGGMHSTVKAMKAGTDLEMSTNKENYDDWFYANPLIEAVKNGEIPESLVDEKVADVLRVMIRTNVLDPEKRFANGSMNTAAHHNEAYREAVEAVVLLKNDNNLLPLDVNKIKSVAVIGDNATRKHSSEGLSSEIKALYEITPLEGLKRKLGDKVKINFAQGYEKTSKFAQGINNGLGAGALEESKKADKKLIAEAVEAAKKSDVAIVFCGLNHDFDTESSDKPYYQLPYGQDELISEVCKANKNTVVVVVAGSAVDLTTTSICAPSIVWGWLNGMEAGNAMAAILTGDENPSGKMPFTVAYSLNQYPAHAFNNFPGSNGAVYYDEGIYVGYRWFETKKQAALYPFGFGLSYTTFEFANIKTDKKDYGKDETVKVSFTLKNTGARKGAEVAQLYVHDVQSSVDRPAKELKAFKKVFLNAGETKTVELEVPVSSLAFYDEATHAFVVESGEFQIQLGAAVNDIKLTTTINVK